MNQQTLNPSQHNLLESQLQHRSLSPYCNSIYLSPFDIYCYSTINYPCYSCCNSRATENHLALVREKNLLFQQTIATDSGKSSFETLGSQDSEDKSYSKEENEDETLAQAQAKAKIKLTEKVQPEGLQGYVGANAFSHSFH